MHSEGGGSAGANGRRANAIVADERHLERHFTPLYEASDRPSRTETSPEWTRAVMHDQAQYAEAQHAEVQHAQLRGAPSTPLRANHPPRSTVHL